MTRRRARPQRDGEQKGWFSRWAHCSTAWCGPSDLTTVAPYMFWLIFRNVASDGFVSRTWRTPASCRNPGARSPRRRGRTPPRTCHRTTSATGPAPAAIVAIELAAGPLPTSQLLIDYVQFAQTCQNPASGIGHFDRASFLINGTPRSWTGQTDRPNLQALAILRLFAQCFHAVTANTVGIPVPGWLSTAIPWLQNALASHRNGQCYQSAVPVPTDDRAPATPTSTSSWRRSTAASPSRTLSSSRQRHCCAAGGPTRRRSTSIRSTGRSVTRHRPHARALSGGRVRRRYR